MASQTQWTWVGASSGVGDGQGSLVCWGSWGCKQLDMTEQLNWMVPPEISFCPNCPFRPIPWGLRCLVTWGWSTTQSEPLQPPVLAPEKKHCREDYSISCGKPWWERICKGGYNYVSLYWAHLCMQWAHESAIWIYIYPLLLEPPSHPTPLCFYLLNLSTFFKTLTTPLFTGYND